MPTSQARVTTCRSTQSYWYAVVVLRTSQVYVIIWFVVLWIQQAWTDVVSVAQSTVQSDLKLVRSKIDKLN